MRLTLKQRIRAAANDIHEEYYLSVKIAAKKWDVSPAQVNALIAYDLSEESQDIQQAKGEG